MRLRTKEKFEKNELKEFTLCIIIYFFSKYFLQPRNLRQIKYLSGLSRVIFVAGNIIFMVYMFPAIKSLEKNKASNMRYRDKLQ